MRQQMTEGVSSIIPLCTKIRLIPQTHILYQPTHLSLCPAVSSSTRPSKREPLDHATYFTGCDTNKIVTYKSLPQRREVDSPQAKTEGVKGVNLFVSIVSRYEMET